MKIHQYFINILKHIDIVILEIRNNISSINDFSNNNLDKEENNSDKANKKPLLPNNSIKIKESAGKEKIFTNYTYKNDFGLGSIFYLDSHSLYCEIDKVMQGFHLTTPSSSTISYEYACLQAYIKGQPYHEYTPPNETADDDKNLANY